MSFTCLLLFSQFLAWIESLSSKQSPVWLGLPDTAENVLLTQLATKTRVKMMRMQQIDDEEDDVGISADGERAGQDDGSSLGSKQTKDGRPSWMKTLGTMVTEWLSKLPKSLPLLKRSRDNIKDPLFR